MNKVISLIIVYLLFVNIGYTQIIDETGSGVLSNKSMTDRNMNVRFNLQSIQKLFDSSGLKENIRKEVYSSDRIYKIRLRESMVTYLILPANEKIAAYSLGDKTNFQFVPNQSNKYKLDNFTTIRGVHAGADTNLTIIGESGRVYPYYIRIDSVDSNYAPDFVHRVYLLNNTEKTLSLKISKNIPKLSEQAGKITSDYLRSLPNVDVSKLNFKYKESSGDKKLSPIRIFDDGYFTYFQYSKETHIDKPRSLPVLYRVVDGFDTPVNSRIENGMLVAETVSDKWTLRAGTAHLCIRKIK